MATWSSVVAFLAILVVALPALGEATVHVVGGYSGWTPNFDYNAWAQGREFFVGDALVFQYPRGYDSVFKASAYEFLTCSMPPAFEALTSGNDMIILETPGRQWFISGAGNGINCRTGEKLVITVLPTYSQETPSPFPFTFAPSEAPVASPSSSETF